MTPGEVKVEEDGAVAVVTIDAAARENILSDALLDQLLATFDGLAGGDGPRALVLTGAGDEVFLIGADPAAVIGFDADAARRASRRGQALADRIADMPMPTIAAVNGAAVGGGLEMVLACDLVLCSTRARFLQLETGIGLVPGFGGTLRLPRRIGPGRAALMTFTAAPISAETALAWGLVLEVTAPEDLRPRAEALGREIARNDGPALRAAKALLADADVGGRARSHAAEAAAFARLAGAPALKSRIGALMAERARAAEARGSA